MSSAVLNTLDIVCCFLSVVTFYCYVIVHDKTVNNEDSSKSSMNRIVATVILSMVYGFCLFVLSDGNRIGSKVAMALFPILIAGVEKLFHNNKKLLYIVSLFAISAIDIDIAIVSVIFIFLYFLTFEYKNVKHFLTFSRNILFSDVIALGLSAVFIVINPLNDRIVPEHSLRFPEFSIKADLNSIFNVFVNLGLPAGIVVGVLIMFYIFGKEYSVSRIKKLILFIFLISAYYVTTSAYILNGFMDSQSKMFSFTVTFFSLQIAGEEIRKLERKEKNSGLVKIILGLIILETVCGFVLRFVYPGTITQSSAGKEEYSIRVAKEHILEKNETADIYYFDGEDSYPDPVSRVLMGYKYVVVPSGVLMDSTLEYSGSYDGVDVYEDKNLSIYGSACSNKELKGIQNSEYPFYVINDLISDKFGIEDIYITVSDDIRVVPDMKDKTYRTTFLYESFDEDGEYYSNLYQVSYLGKLSKGDEGVIKCNKSVEELKEDILQRHCVYLDKEKYSSLISRLNTDYSETLGDKTESDNVKSNLIGFLISIISAVAACFYVRSKRNRGQDAFDKLNRVERFISDNIIYFYTVIISLTVYIIILMVNQCIPFGDNSAIISDGLISDYPTNMYTVQNLRSLNFKAVDYVMGFQWGGIGVSSFLYFINPVRLVLLLFPNSMSLLGFNVYYMLEFLLIGPCMLFYLTHRPYGGRMDKKEKKLVPIALCYNLSSFVLCYYSFNGFLEIAMILPIIMLAMERLVYERKYILYTVILTLYIIESTYYAFILCIFLFMYFFVLEHKNVKTFFFNGLRFAVFSLLSGGIASFTLFSFYSSVTNSGYVESDMGSRLTINVFTQNLIGSLTDFEVIHKLTRATSYWELANTYCGILLIITLPLFMFAKKISLSSRIRRLVLMFILYFAYGNELLNYVFHGFHFQTLVPNRFSIFFIFMMVTAFYDTVCCYKEIFDKNAILMFGGFSVFVLFGIYFKTTNPLLAVIISVGFIIAYFLVVFSGYTKGKQYQRIRYLLVGLCMELIISTLYTSVLGFTFSEQKMFIDSYKTIKRLSDEYALNNGITRTSVISASADNRACLTGIKTVDIFSSSLQQEQINLAAAWNIDPDKNSISYDYGNALADIMLNVKYYIINSNTADEVMPTYLEPVKTRNNLTLYQNPYVVSDGIMLPEDISDINRMDYTNMIDYQNAVTNRLVGKNLYNEIEAVYIADDYSAELEDKNYLRVQGANTEGVFAADVTTRKGFSGDIYMSVLGRVIYAGNVDGVDTRYTGIMIMLSDAEIAKLEQTENERCVKAFSLNRECYEELKKYQERNYISDITVTGDSIMLSTSSEEDGILYVPILQSASWKVVVDDQEKNTLNVFGGVGVPVDSGMHDIKISAISKTDFKRYILSIISIVVFILIICINRKNKVDEISVK